MLEAAAADAACPEADALPTPPLAALRRASLAAGRLLRLSWRGGGGGELRAAAGGVAAALDEAGRGPLPPLVEPRVPEGYAYYALYPETYLAAAERLAASLGPGPEGLVCVGIRSIGTSLSATVAAPLEAAGHRVESLTLRPRGHPFARRPALAPGLAAALRARAGEGWRFLVVDEGPGLSGSSLAGAAEALAALGVPDGRVVLFPSHLPDPAGFRSEAARERWPRLAKAHVPFEEAWLPRAPFPPDGSRDVAGGAWREALGLPESEWPAVQPQHERRKYLAGDPAGGGRHLLHKFAGLGRRGRRAHARGMALAEAGFAPPVAGLAGGFLAQVLVPGRPLGARDAADRELLAAAGRYFGHLAQEFALGAPARPALLLDMVCANVAEGLGEHRLADLRGAERHLRGLGEAPAVAIDGRVLRHEWLRTTAGGYLKTDATDHHDDHFFPGPADIAWDVAAFGAEFALPDAALEALAADVAGRARDPGLVGRIPYYAIAYLAFRLGYTTLAAATLAGTPDGRRMAVCAEDHRAQLDIALRRLAGSAPSFTSR